MHLFSWDSHVSFVHLIQSTCNKKQEDPKCSDYVISVRAMIKAIIIIICRCVQLFVVTDCISSSGKTPKNRELKSTYRICYMDPQTRLNFCFK